MILATCLSGIGSIARHRAFTPNLLSIIATKPSVTNRKAYAVQIS